MYGKDLKQHLDNLTAVFDRLDSANLKLKAKKCNFSAEKLSSWDILFLKVELNRSFQGRGHSSDDRTRTCHRVTDISGTCVILPEDCARFRTNRCLHDLTKK